MAYQELTQFINSIQQAKPEMREVIKEVKEVSR